MSIPKPPEGAGPTGRRLWKSIQTEFRLEEHETVLLTQAVRTADHCDELQRLVDRDGPMAGDRPNPALVELRQQQIVLSRLFAALRVPLGDDETDVATRKHGSPRLQRRGGARGAYKPRVLSS